MGEEEAKAPSFGDLGSKSDDLFNSGFNYGFYGLTCSTKTSKDQEFNVELKKEIESNEVSGSIGATLVNVKEHGFVLKQSWDTENTLTTDASFEDPLNLEGFTLGVENTYQPNSKEQDTTVKSSFVTEQLNFECNYDVSAKNVSLSSVLALEGYLAGFALDYDVGQKKVGDYTIAMGVDNDDITCHAAVTNFNQFNGSMYRKVNNELETGAFVSYSKENGNHFGMAAKYIPHEDTVLTAKVNNSAELGLSFQQVIRPGVSLTLSSLIQSKNFHAGGHKVGVGLELNP